MKIKQFLFTLLIVVFFKTTISYSQNDTLIIWTKNKKLNWSDFQSKERVISFDGAQSMVGIKIKPFLSNNGIYNYKAFAYFKKNKSWADTININAFILKHEQVHFDIAELFARKMRKAVYNLKLKNEIVLPADYRLIHDKFYALYRDYQDKYDLETDHARIYKMQIKWDKKVAKELEELKDYGLKIDTCKTSNSSN